MVIGSMQAHAYRGSIDGPAPCVNAAAGMGGGHVPMVTEENDNRGGYFGKVKQSKMETDYTSEQASNFFVVGFQKSAAH